ncbi:TonB-dependent receptor [Reinekea sp.]|jgi:vitamin B12 transporter|uniref:TonB-dependent receptor n=1 Tax=Reinekea sp. TaxID=1970455 RepID=UPI003989DED4
MSQKFLISAGLLFLSCSLFSEQQNDPLPVQSQLPVVYSEITPAYETSPEFSNAAVSVISSEQFHANDVTVADVLELTPGIQLQSTGETGAYSSLSIRGAPSQQTQVFIDGVLQSNAGGGGSNVQSILLADIERIEVYKSSSPGQLAMGSPGGAINIIRKKSSQNEASLLLELGSFEHGRMSATVNQQYGRYIVNGYAALQYSGNAFEYINDNGTANNSLDDYPDTRNNAEFSSRAAGASVTRETNNGNAGFAVSYYSDVKQLPDSHNTKTNKAYYAQEKLSALATLNVNQWLPNIDTSLRFDLEEDTGLFNNTDGSTSLYKIDSEDTLSSGQLNHSSVYSAPFGLITAANIISYDQFIIDDSDKGETLNATRTQFANSLGAEVFYSDLVTLMSNVRLLSLTDNSGDVTEQKSSIGGNAGLRVGNEVYFMQVNAQQAYRVPNLVERFGNQGAFSGNSELLDESATSFDLTVYAELAIVKLEASVYVRDSKNTMTPVYNAQGMGRYINLDSTQFVGYEWQVGTELGRFQLQHQGAYSYSLATSSLKAYDQKRVPGYYPISLNNNLNYQLSEQWNTQFNYLYEAGLYFDRANSTQAPEKHQLNAQVRWQHENSSLTFGVDNILDRAHFDYSRKPLPGRTYTLTYEHKFGEKP